jgi:hypothetical protein
MKRGEIIKKKIIKEITKLWKGSDVYVVRAKFLVYFMKHHIMKMYGGVEV